VLRSVRQASEPDQLIFDGQGRRIATLFSDIAGFTSLVERTEPKVLCPLISAYLSGMMDIAIAYGGTVAEIVGDALHILFEASGEPSEHADRTIACSFALDNYAQSFRTYCQERGVALGVTRIGAHLGTAILGRFGVARMFEVKAFGDAINIAARLEEANKHFGTRILVSENLACNAKAFCGRPVGDLILRGKSEPIRAFEPLTTGQNDHPEVQSYLKAFASLENSDPQSLAAFAAHVSLHPNDQLAAFHLKRLLSGAFGARIVLEQ
jgi:class 3 adenylate cyclase